MKKQIAKIAIFSLIAAALMAVPTISRAQDTSATPPAAAKKATGRPFHGKVTAVDTTASTITIKDMVLTINSDTKITKDGQPGTLADITVGAAVRGACKTTAGDKLTATSIAIGAKGKKAAQ